MIKRNITNMLTAALADSPVALLNGARQSGKSTLIQWLVENQYPATYLTLDDPTVLAAIHHDPTGLLRLCGISGINFENPTLRRFNSV